ncbi:hypothetical protein [Aurantimonas sp. VKM B-3413]|uniref:hypothetical protein n=1 Tax=Aurantimonas sp. VKM B-3413 TaxID=2779401 RepID=UPI001E4CF5B5|nr:hypothetical protein [Aurantimonas sp. VKM B-3413]MCB8840271.1 hypothetical protein [Aurantimonas sp. VKM B-3413]
MKSALAIAGILTRLLVVLAVLSGASLQSPASEWARFDASASEMSEARLDPATRRHGNDAGHAMSHVTDTHEHTSSDDGDCSLHCATALPQAATVRTSTQIVRTIVYAAFSEHRAGRTAPALERPPRA